ncbi:MAG: DUF3791 domain-containing protein [Lactobacillales bacterium]|nr:DUF3791 domain-containing protein [Lactobacillales bacterium]
MSKEANFFIYLIENYAEYKGITAGDVVKLLDEKNLTEFVYSMYEMYHIERLENAYEDIDSLIETGAPAW